MMYVPMRLKINGQSRITKYSCSFMYYITNIYQLGFSNESHITKRHYFFLTGTPWSQTSLRNEKEQQWRTGLLSHEGFTKKSIQHCSSWTKTRLQSPFQKAQAYSWWQLFHETIVNKLFFTESLDHNKHICILGALAATAAAAFYSAKSR